MEVSHFSKLISNIPQPDIVITMGCNVNCPYLPSRHREDWGLDDPTGKCDAEFAHAIKPIYSKIDNLRERIADNKL